MRRTSLLLVLCITCLTLTAGEVPAQDGGSGIIFTGCPPYVQGYHCDSMFYQVVAVDLSTGKQCPEMKYLLVSGPGTINPKTGLWVFHPEKEDLTWDRRGSWRDTVEIAAHKGNDTTTSDENCRFLITVTDHSPNLAGGNYQQLKVSVGDTLVVPLTLTDDDWCDEPRVDSVRFADPASGSFAYDPESKIVTFVPDSADAGKHFDVYITISSGPVTRHCTLHINVAAVMPTYIVRLGHRQNQYQGQFCDIPITLTRFDTHQGMGGFDFLVGYDASALAFQMALEGDLYEACAWEYFSYRFCPDTACGDACSSGLLRLVGMAETNNGAIHPNPGCAMTNPGWVDSIPTTLANIRFLVSNDRRLEGRFVPIRFFWKDCGDNVVSSGAGDRLYLSHDVHELDGFAITDTAPFPTYLGTRDECVIEDVDNNRYTSRAVDFYNGGVQIIEADSLDCYGDVNMNGRWYELADAMALTGYFFETYKGPGTLDTLECGDANQDGRITIADIVRLYRIIAGDAAPGPLSPSPNPAAFVWDTVTGVVSMWSLDTLGAIYMIVEGQVTPAALSGEETTSIVGSDLTRILIYANNGSTAILPGPIERITGATGIVEIQAATREGRAVTTSLEVIGTASTPYTIRLGVARDCDRNQYVDIPITLENFDPSQGLGGFNLQLGYDASALAFQLAAEGDIYDSCAWEYFTYRYGPFGTCDTSCPTGMLRIVGIAETNNGEIHPNASCAAITPGWVPTVPVTLASLRFLTGGDWTLECQVVPLRFFWYDCGDNTLTNHDGSELYLSASVIEYNEYEISGVEAFPTYRGAQEECVYIGDSQSKRAIRGVDYYDGWIDFQCPFEVDAPGDVDLNGVPWQMYDVVMFRNYFLQGFGAFGGHVAGSIAATDVNRDDKTLTVEDYQYMLGVVTGKITPAEYCMPSPNLTRVFWRPETGDVSFETIDSLGIAWLLVEGTVTPTLLAEGMEMIYHSDSGWTKILIYSTEWGPFIRSGPALRIAGALRIAEVSAATYDALSVETEILDRDDFNRGDVDLNGVSYELNDAWVFASYLLRGASAFDPRADSSVIRSDVDRDGVPLELQDLAFLLRVYKGEVGRDDLPSQTPAAQPATFDVSVWSVVTMVSVQTADSIGAVRLVLSGSVSVFLADPYRGYSWGRYEEASNSTVVLIWSKYHDFAVGSGPLCFVSSPSEILEVEAVTVDARPMRTVISAPTGVEEPADGLPGEFALHGNYPNPFNPVTNIAYDLPERADVQITVYNVVGQVVRTLADRVEAAGRHEVAWDGRDDSGAPVSSGLYLYRMTAGDFTQSRKMLLLK